MDSKSFLAGVLICLSCMISPAIADREKRKICGSPDPVLSVADFNGDGVVDKKDKILIKKVIKKQLYYAFYDRNVDGVVNEQDKMLTVGDIGKTSSKTDQELAKVFHQLKQFQIADTKIEIRAMGQIKRTESLKGHGEHWMNATGIQAIRGNISSVFSRVEGLNMSAKGKTPWAAFWGQAAKPVFENGATDYPQPGGQWMNSRVIAFEGHPPRFTSSPNETWHTHAGLCFTTRMVNGKKTIILDQHTTFLECQALPNLEKTEINGIKINAWVNIWMLHLWIFELNPDGLFANTHRCLDPKSPPEHTTNGDREVPDFFKHHDQANNP